MSQDTHLYSSIIEQIRRDTEDFAYDLLFAIVQKNENGQAPQAACQLRQFYDREGSYTIVSNAEVSKAPVVPLTETLPFNVVHTRLKEMGYDINDLYFPNIDGASKIIDKKELPTAANRIVTAIGSISFTFAKSATGYSTVSVTFSGDLEGLKNLVTKQEKYKSRRVIRVPSKYRG